MSCHVIVAESEHKRAVATFYVRRLLKLHFGVWRHQLSAIVVHRQHQSLVQRIVLSLFLSLSLHLFVSD